MHIESPTEWYFCISFVQKQKIPGDRSRGEDGENESDVCLRPNSPETSSKADVLVEGLANGC